MTQHVHYDLDAMRAQFLANADTMFTEAMGRAKSDNDRLYVQTQRTLSPALTEMMVRMADAANQGLPIEMIVRSVGITLGKMAGSTVASCGGNDDVIVPLMDAFTSTLNACMTNAQDLPTSIVSGESRFAPTPAGHG